VTAEGRPPGAPDPAKVSEVIRSSAHHERFLELTLEQRDDASGRALLDSEWRYIGPLLGARGPGNLTALDLACGSGYQSLAWAERGFRVHGLDFDHALLLAGRERVRRASEGRLTVEWNHADATKLPYRDGAFDIVFNNSLLEHVPAWRDVLSETSRVLRPGGLFIMYTTNRACPLQQEVNHFPGYPWLPDPIQRRVLAWIMKNRRDLVNFTDFPAINWFTFGQMRKAFRSVGLEPFDRLDLIARNGGGGTRGAVAGILSRSEILKAPYHLYARSMALYGVRKARA
jgi:2-polyprenyl-6-hydroxyphenyl methylase/3-demethylubiquinone-9 3-methyltransferase